ncbi:response regulator transcription factor [Patescibacteria group bacterium]
MNILVVEDESKLADILKEGLEVMEYKVDLAYDGRAGLDKAKQRDYDLVILDLMLPELDGFEVCHQIRTSGQEMPILILTACGVTEDRVKGLDMGADDYMVKPFDFDELSARIRALLRRHKPSSFPVYQVGALELNAATREVSKEGEPITLTPTEFDLLEYLMKNPSQVFSREQILQQIRPFDYMASSNIVDVYVNYLRRKIDDNDKRTIQTVSGVGYKMINQLNTNQ